MRRFVTAALGGAMAMAALVAGPAAAADAAPGKLHCAAPLLDAPAHGMQATSRLGGSLAEAAARNGVTGRQLADQLQKDHTLWLDRCGKRFFVDSDLVDTGSGAASAAAASATPAASHPYDQTFRLHSRPGSAHTIYLDFTGYVVSGTAWNTSPTNASGGDFTAPGYDTDGDPATFSTAEQDVVQAVWASVAEDYAPFDVDVTTEEPTADALARTSADDATYGTRAVITSLAGPAPGNDCGCGGIAYIGTFNTLGGTTYQPAFVFYRAVGSGWKGIAEAAAHEVGHNLGLSHDGLTAAGGGSDYYTGSKPWAPIMGAGYYHPVTQWSRGEYANANNTEDDLAVIAAHGAPFVTDDYPDGAAGAPVLVDGTPAHGVISTTSDTDWFRLDSAGGAMSVVVAPADLNPDLDVALTVYAADGTTVVARSAPTTQETSTTTATGLGASWSSAALPAGTYYAVVDGVGTGDPTQPGGYSDYASLGAYTITASTVGSLAVTTSGLPTAEVGTAYTARVAAAGGTGPRTFAATGLPAGLRMTADGVISGTPSGSGTQSLSVTVTDATGATTVRSLGLAVAPALVAAAGPAPEGIVGTAYAHVRTASGGVAPYAWSATGLPAGLAIDSSTGTIHGTATAPFTGTATVTVTDAAGGRSSAPVRIGIAGHRLTVSSAPLAGTVRATQTAVLTAHGGVGAYHWAWGSRRLPLALSADGRLTGAPPAAGTFIGDLRVTDAEGVTATAAVTLAVRQPVVVTTTALTGATRGRSYRVRVGAAGGDGHYRWSGAGLPAGLTLSSTGTLAGNVRSTAVSATVTVRVVDSAGRTAVRRLPVAVAAPPRVTTTALPTARRGTAYAVVLHRTGGTAGFRWSLVRGALPPGVALRADGSLRGRPQRRGTWTLTVRVTDRWGATAVRRWRVAVR